MTVQIDTKMFSFGVSDMTDFWFSINLTKYIEMDTKYELRIMSAKEANVFYIVGLPYIKDFHKLISYLHEAFSIQDITLIDHQVEINHVLSKRCICIKLTDKERNRIATLLRLRGCNIKSF